MRPVGLETTVVIVRGSCVSGCVPKGLVIMLYELAAIQEAWRFDEADVSRSIFRQGVAAQSGQIKRCTPHANRIYSRTPLCN